MNAKIDDALMFISYLIGIVSYERRTVSQLCVSHWLGSTELCIGVNLSLEK